VPFLDAPCVSGLARCTPGPGLQHYCCTNSRKRKQQLLSWLPVLFLILPCQSVLFYLDTVHTTIPFNDSQHQLAPVVCVVLPRLEHSTISLHCSRNGTCTLFFVPPASLARLSPVLVLKSHAHCAFPRCASIAQHDTTQCTQYTHAFFSRYFPSPFAAAAAYRLRCTSLPSLESRFATDRHVTAVAPLEMEGKPESHYRSDKLSGFG
jgi:hypothetical protein